MPRGQGKQQRGHPVIRILFAQQHVQFTISTDFVTHQAKKVVLQRRDFLRQILQLGKRNLANRRRLQRLGIGDVMRGADTVHAEHLTGEIEPGNLLVTLITEHIGLQCAGANRIDRFEIVGSTVKVFATFKRATAVDNVVQLVQLGGSHRQRKTDRAEAAFITGNVL